MSIITVYYFQQPNRKPSRLKLEIGFCVLHMRRTKQRCASSVHVHFHSLAVLLLVSVLTSFLGLIGVLSNKGRIWSWNWCLMGKPQRCAERTKSRAERDDQSFSIIRRDTNHLHQFQTTHNDKGTQIFKEMSSSDMGFQSSEAFQ